MFLQEKQEINFFKNVISHNFKMKKKYFRGKRKSCQSAVGTAKLWHIDSYEGLTATWAQSS